MEKRVFALACLVLTFALCAWSQRAPSRSRSSSSAAPSRSAAPSAPAVRSGGGSSSGYVSYGGSGYSRSRPGGFGPSRSRQFQPTRLTGRVTLPGGGVSPEPAQIQAVCPGQIYPLTYCGLNGRFSVSLRDLSLLGFASGWGGFSSFTRGGYGGCGVRAFLPGYFSRTVSLRSWFRNGTLQMGDNFLRRIPNIEGHTVSITTLAAPKEAKRAYKKGLDHYRNKRYEKAEEQFEIAVDEYPDYAAAWAFLGETRLALGYESGVREAFERALEIDPKYLKPHRFLIEREIEDEDWERAAELAKSAIRLNPFDNSIRYYLGFSQYKSGDLDEAFVSARAGLSNRPGDLAQPQINRLLGLILAKQGKYEPAADRYRRVLAAWPSSDIAPVLRQQLSEWRASGLIARSQVEGQLAQTLLFLSPDEP